MKEIKTLELTLQDLPRDVLLDLPEAEGEAVLERAIESLKSEVLYNSRFEDDSSNGQLEAEVISHRGTTYTLRLTFQNAFHG